MIDYDLLDDEYENFDDEIDPALLRMRRVRETDRRPKTNKPTRRDKWASVGVSYDEDVS